MNYSKSWDQGSRCYEPLKEVDDMDDLGSYELRALNVINNSRLCMIWTIIGHELEDLDAMNNSRLWMIYMKDSGSRELKALAVINSSRLRMAWTTLEHELRALDAMNNLGLWITWKTLGCELGEFDIVYKRRTTLKGQIFNDFINKFGSESS